MSPPLISQSPKKHLPAMLFFPGNSHSLSQNAIQNLELTPNHRSWFNREQEMYQNCAVIHIQKGGAGISSLPDMFVANIGTECFTPRRDADVLFPDPGTDIVYGDWYYGIRYPSGPNCAPIKSMPKIGDTVTLAVPPMADATASLTTQTPTTLLTRTGEAPSVTIRDNL